MRPPRLIEPTVEDLRLIPPAALRLWRALIRSRDRGGLGELDWFLEDLRTLAGRARQSYSTAKASLALLRRAGLVATERTKQARWIRCRETKMLTTVNALEQNLYLVPGTLVSRGGIDVIEFPEHRWKSWVGKARSDLRRRRNACVEPWRTDLPGLDSYGPGFFNSVTELGPKLSTSDYSYMNSKSLKSEASEKAAARILSPMVEALIDLAAADDDEDEVTASGKKTVFGGVFDRPVRLPPVGPLPYLVPDRYEKQPALVSWISPEHGAEQKALLVLDGFRRAVREVYGIGWWGYSKGVLKLAKGYDKLVAAGVALAEHSVPPDHWAIWRLRWIKKNRRGDKPPPIHVVMNAKHVSERAGWFRKEYDLPAPVFQLDPIIHEQNLRNREARRRWQWPDADNAWIFMASFPPWYVEKRRAEMKDGMDSPHDCWPTKPGSRYGRITK